MSAPTHRSREPEECAATPRRAAAFLAGSLPADELRALRAHREHCRACDATWRNTITAASNLGKRGRGDHGAASAEELAEQRAERRRQTISDGFSATLFRGGDKGRRAHLRLLLLPALALFLASVIWPMASRNLPGLEVLAGQVELDGRVLSPVDGRTTIHRGNWCSTSPSSRALLTLGDTAVELAPDSSLLVEDDAEGRLRLDTGELRVSGDCLVTTGWGVVLVEDAEGLLRAGPDGLEIETISGTLTASDSHGEVTLSAGERGRLAVRAGTR